MITFVGGEKGAHETRYHDSPAPNVRMQNSAHAFMLGDAKGLDDGPGDAPPAGP